MKLSDINWDPNKAGTWPVAIKSTIIIIVCSIVIGAVIYFDTIAQLDSLNKLEKKEDDLKNTFESRQKKAVSLPDHQDQLKQIEASLDEMIRQMPTEEEVASLLVDISQTGLASGLEFRLFKPNVPVRKDFYSELPIGIQVIGKYKELGTFISGLAALPRIVTVHDITIEPTTNPKNKNDPDNSYNEDILLMSATVKTYNEGSANASYSDDKKKDKKKGKKKDKENDKGGK